MSIVDETLQNKHWI